MKGGDRVKTPLDETPHIGSANSLRFPPRRGIPARLFTALKAGSPSLCSTLFRNVDCDRIAHRTVNAASAG
jgi:hypothetical protein